MYLDSIGLKFIVGASVGIEWIDDEEDVENFLIIDLLIVRFLFTFLPE